jgi:2-oxoglutarate dehydrogenase E2 component (dihydrolipoamide succinyltransferase)
VLLEIRVQEGETVPVNSVVAVIGAEQDRAALASQTTALSSASPGQAPGAARAPERNAPTSVGATGDAGDRRRTHSSPVVRRLAAEHGIDLEQVPGTGAGGRVTKEDLDAFLAARAAPAVPAPPPAPGAPPAAFSPPVVSAAGSTRVEKMSVMRRKIAEHMVQSVRTAAHVYAAYEVDFARVDALRQAKKADYEALGVKLTYTGFIAKAAIDTIRDFPYVNASVDGDRVIYHQDVNLGIAVALDQGLIVPVIRGAGDRSMAALCREIQDLADRARTKRLMPEDVQGGTFTITNPGIFGALFGLPIISQPQVAILGVGAVEKRAVVVDDAIAVRPTSYLSLGFDHRLIDGADAGRFLQALKERLQDFQESWL